MSGVRDAVRGHRGIFPALVRFAARRWRILLALFAGVLLPLLGFGMLANDVMEHEGLFWDAPILHFVHDQSTPALDRFMLFMSAIGYAWGVVPAVPVLFIILMAYRRRGDALFFALAVGGAGLMNRGAKLFFRRTRPALWTSIAPETSFSFPSGHAMGSMALAAAVVALLWPTRWRWPAIVVGGAFTFLVGLSRVYLGVHYPSDVLAGWSASLAWVVGVSFVAYGRAAKPRPSATPTAELRNQQVAS
ncbi:undecaprenyl-diphosphatase [Longimicrobium terrae]|uniref:phosphatase PAP2 family protein n=1 Tax=Longimicrobium terrae TaxID=1639882 RepID=UPI0017D24514|nr:undecaprenyl-diphosphatase [Longimicrobium terrae]